MKKFSLCCASLHFAVISKKGHETVSWHLHIRVPDYQINQVAHIRWCQQVQVKDFTREDVGTKTVSLEECKIGRPCEISQVHVLLI